MENGLQTQLMRDADCHVSGRMCCDPGTKYSMFISVATATCGVPPSPASGSVDFTSTGEGSIAAFQCDTGLVPEELFAAVCSESGEWAPSPGDLSCSQPDQGE